MSVAINLPQIVDGKFQIAVTNDSLTITYIASQNCQVLYAYPTAEGQDPDLFGVHTDDESPYGYKVAIGGTPLTITPAAKGKPGPSGRYVISVVDDPSRTEPLGNDGEIVVNPPPGNGGIDVKLRFEKNGHWHRFLYSLEHGE